MTVRVRFAPSPTGQMHIGNARTALYNYYFARAQQGTFVLRIEDTDEARSTKEFEQILLSDLKWLGLEYDEGPEKPGDYGPYRQSERKHLYKEYAQKLLDEDKAYYCFCSEEVLNQKKELAMQSGRPPHYDGTCRNLSTDEVGARLSAGEAAVVRFKVPPKSYVHQDKVRGRVVFPEGMVGDFVLLRSGMMPVYNFCCVVDDGLMKITHVIRGEDHLSNTVRQLMLYEALGWKPPEFAHASLLIGKDRQKLSKRHGDVSLHYYKEESYLASAITNYLCLLGWSHPEEKDIFDGEELKRVFNLERFSKSPAIFDSEKFQWVNGQHLRSLPADLLLQKIDTFIPQDHAYHQQKEGWKKQVIELFKDQIQFFQEILKPLDELFMAVVEKNEQLQEILAWETTPTIHAYLQEQLTQTTSEFVTEETFEKWGQHIKKELKIKGKPLFMGIRAVLTGQPHGPELKHLIPLTPVKVLQQRVEQVL